VLRLIDLQINALCKKKHCSEFKDQVAPCFEEYKKVQECIIEEDFGYNSKCGYVDRDDKTPDEILELDAQQEECEKTVCPSEKAILQACTNAFKDKNLGVSLTDKWVYDNEDNANYKTVLFTDAEIEQLREIGALNPSLKVHCDLYFRIQRDNSDANSYFKYVNLDDGKTYTQLWRGGYANHFRFEMIRGDCTRMYCHQASNNRGSEATCPWSSAHVLLTEVDFSPRSRSSHNNEWHRNKFSMTGTRYYATINKPTENLGVTLTDDWNFNRQDSQFFRQIFFTQSDIEKLRNQGLLNRHIKIECDVDFITRRDDSSSSTYFRYINLANGKYYTQKFHRDNIN